MVTPWAPYADPAGALEAAAGGLGWSWCSRSGLVAAEAALRARLELTDGEPATEERIRTASGKTVDVGTATLATWRRNRNYYRRTLERFQRR